MFFVGLSGSFIPYFLLIGFMVISFLGSNHENSSGIIDDIEEHDILVSTETVNRIYSDKLVYVLDKCERSCVSVINCIIPNVVSLSPWSDYFVVSSERSLFYHFISKDNLFGLSPPVAHLLSFQVC